jgi:small subunit ribosomal protein S18
MGENLSTRDAIERLNQIENKSEERQGARPEKRVARPVKKRVCPFCMEKDPKTKKPLYIDYKDGRLRKYLMENGKILPRKQTGLCSAHQRELAKAIKTARKMSLL